MKNQTFKRYKHDHIPDHSDEPVGTNIPQSFVIRMPTVQSQSLAELVLDIRRVMQPHTALHLKEAKRNKLKDFVAVAGNLSVSHFLLIGQTLLHSTLRICHFPQGPSLFFNILEYSLIRDIINTNSITNSNRILHRQGTNNTIAYQNPPLVILNGFPEDHSSKELLVSTFLQNMFPPINISKMKSSDIKRIVLFHYENDLIHFRHYRVNINDISISKPVRDIIKASSSISANKKLQQKISQTKDISEFLLNQFDGAESESEDLIATRQSDKKSVKVIEIGPRMTLELIKIVQGFNDDGTVLYNKYHKQ